MFSLLFYIIAATSLNGYFEGELVADKLRQPAQWNMWNPKSYFEMKISSSPSRFVNLYFSINMSSNWNSSQVTFNQGHLTFEKNRVKFNFFTREDQFWVESPLLFLLNTDRIKDDNWGPKAEALRIDFWEHYGFSGTFIYSKYTTWDGEAYVGRLDKSFNSSTSLGILYLKKDWRGGRSPTFNDVVSLRGRFPFIRNSRIRFEGAISRYPYEEEPTLHERTAYHIELRNLRLKNLSTTAAYFHYGRDFIDELSNKFNPAFDHEFDRNGVYAEFVYLMPNKAVNLIYKTSMYRTHYIYPLYFDNPFWIRWQYGEVYIEFLGGINGKMSYEVYKEKSDVWKHFLFEVVGENKTMRVKFQYKIKDIGVNRGGWSKFYSIGERHLVGVELRVNLTNSLQFYGRGAVGMGTFSDWESVFLQLAYRGFKNTEIYLEYGVPCHTDYDLVNDPDVADYPFQKIVDRVKLLIKFWF